MSTDTTPSLRDRFTAALLATPRTGWTYEPGQEKWDHHQAGPGEPGHSYSMTCALCAGDLDALTTALLAALPPQICGATAPTGVGGQSLGPCLLPPHEGVVHQGPDGTKWWRTPEADTEPALITVQIDRAAVAEQFRRAYGITDTTDPDKDEPQ